MDIWKALSFDYYAQCNYEYIFKHILVDFQIFILLFIFGCYIKDYIVHERNLKPSKWVNVNTLFHHG